MKLGSFIFLYVSFNYNYEFNFDKDPRFSDKGAKFRKLHSMALPRSSYEPIFE